MKVAIVTDIRYGSDGAQVRGSVALPLLEQALQEIETQAPDLLLDLGDRLNVEAASGFLQQRALQEVAACFTEVSTPRVHLQGDNDALPKALQEELLACTLGNQRISNDQFQILVLDTYDGSPAGALSDQTLAWLEHTLMHHAEPALIVSHQPLHGEPIPGNAFFTGAERVYDYQRAREIMARAGNVRLCLSGHVHQNHSVRLNGVTYISVAALAPFRYEAAIHGNYGLVTLDAAEFCTQVFGRDPFRLQLSLERGA